MIDVVIPVYNVEKYIDRCMESVINQTYKDLKVILVDDGSTDRSGAICDEYARRYKNVTAYHKANGGLSSARNYGIEKSTAEIVTFVDSDDFVHRDYLKRLLIAMEKAGADMIISGLTDVWDNSVINEPVDDEVVEVPELGEVIRRVFAQENIDVSSCAKLYKRSLFENIRYPEGEIYEDMKVIIKLLEAADKVAVTSYSGYYYYQREGSIMRGEMSNDRITLMETMEKYMVYVAENYPQANDAVRTRYIRCGFHVLNRALFDNDYKDYAMSLKKMLCANSIYIWCSGNFRKHEKLAVLLLGMNIGIYKNMLGRYRKGLK